MLSNAINFKLVPLINIIDNHITNVIFQQTITHDSQNKCSSIGMAFLSLFYFKQRIHWQARQPFMSESNGSQHFPLHELAISLPI